MDGNEDAELTSTSSWEVLPAEEEGMVLAISSWEASPADEEGLVLAISSSFTGLFSTIEFSSLSKAKYTLREG